MKTSNKLLLALLVGFLIAVLANNFFVKLAYQKTIQTDSRKLPHIQH
ncbi:hypothetical protein [Dyadobacter luticola]|nr:hypothetical protein [Dyadobacter luticola]